MSKSGGSAPNPTAAARSLIRSELHTIIDKDVFDSIEQYIESLTPTLASKAAQDELAGFLKEFCGNTAETNRIVGGFISKYLILLNVVPPVPPASSPNESKPSAATQYPKLDKSAKLAPTPTVNNDSKSSDSNIQAQALIGPSLTNIKKGGSPLNSSAAAFVSSVSQFHVVEKGGKQVKKQQAKQNNESSNVKNNNLNTNSKTVAPNTNVKTGTKHSSKEAAKGDEIPLTICGCFASAHPFYTSCRACGRLHCYAEHSWNRCVDCSAELLPPLSEEDVVNMGADVAVIQAYHHKDRLLQFDKENAKRTHVFDTQSDYYDSSVWLTEEEKKRLQEKENQRVDRYKQRGTRMTISFDVAGRKIVHHDSSDMSSAASTAVDTDQIYEVEESCNTTSSSRNSSYRGNVGTLSHSDLADEESKVGFLFRKMMDSFSSDINSKPK